MANNNVLPVCKVRYLQLTQCWCYKSWLLFKPSTSANPGMHIPLSGITIYFPHKPPVNPQRGTWNQNHQIWHSIYIFFVYMCFLVIKIDFWMRMNSLLSKPPLWPGWRPRVEQKQLNMCNLRVFSSILIIICFRKALALSKDKTISVLFSLISGIFCVI